jgi:hypothetical protein
VGAEVSGLQPDLAQDPEAADCARQPATAEGQDSQDAQRCEWAQRPTHNRRTQPGAPGLGSVLQAGRDQERIGRARRLAQAQAALHPVAAVEAPVYSRQKPDEGGTEGGASVSLSVQPARAVVEQWREPYERGLPERLL